MHDRYVDRSILTYGELKQLGKPFLVPVSPRVRFEEVNIALFFSGRFVAYHPCEKQVSQSGALTLVRTSFAKWYTHSYEIKFRKVVRSPLREQVSHSGVPTLVRTSFAKWCTLPCENNFSQSAILTLVKTSFAKWCSHPCENKFRMVAYSPL